MNDDFDFGFSLVDENFVEPNKKKEQDDIIRKLHLEIDEQKKLTASIVNMIIPLLDNLCKEPEKPTIYWPNRVEKVSQFKEKLLIKAYSE